MPQIGTWTQALGFEDNQYLKWEWTHSLLIRIPHLVDFPVIKNPPANAGDIRDTGSIPGSGRSLEKEMATRSSILAWRIPWTEEPGGLQSTGSQRVGHAWGYLAHRHLVPTYWGSGSLCLSAEWIQREAKWQASSSFIKIRHLWDREMQASRQESSPSRIKWATIV